MHHGCQSGIFLVKQFTSSVCLRYKFLARIVTISLHGEGGERNKVDTIGFFYGCKIGITQAESDYIADTGIVTGACSHPKYIMVTPLYVPVFVCAEQVENQVSAWSTVEDISKNVQLVDDQSLDDIAYRYDEIICAPSINNGVDDTFYIGGFVNVLRVFMK